MEEDANEDSSKKEKDAKKASSEKEEDESKKLGKIIVKEITKAILEEALELAAEYIERASSASESIEQFKGQARLPKFAVPIRQHMAETGLERLQVRRVRGYRGQHRGRYQLHRPQRR